MRSVQWTSTNGFGGWIDNLMESLRNIIKNTYPQRNPNQIFSVTGSDELRASPPPIPPPGIMVWSDLNNLLENAAFFEPGKDGRFLRTGPNISRQSDEAYARMYGQYGVTGVRSYARLAERSWNWWIKQPYVRSLLMRMSPNDRAYVLGRISTYIKILNTN